MTDVICQVGMVSAANVDRVQARVRLPECDNLRTNWLNVLQRSTQGNEDYWLPDVEEQVEVLLDANGGDGIILDVVYSDVDKPPFSDKNIRGTRLADDAEYSYNRKMHALIVRGGTEHVVIECGVDVALKTQKVTTDAPETELTGDLRVRGKPIYKGGMVGSGGEGVTAIIYGNIEIKGSAHAMGSMLSDGENFGHHSH